MGALMNKVRSKTKSASKTKFENIPQDLVQLCDELVMMDSDNTNQNINYKYFLGKRFNEVSDDSKHYTKNGIKYMMGRLGINSMRDVQKVMLFAATYTDAQIEAYNHKYDNVSWAKTRITWSHWDKLLAGYLSIQQREDWMDKTVKNGWNATDLSKQLALANEVGDKHGRSVKKPGSKGELLEKMKKPLDVFKTFYHKVWSDKDNPATQQLTHDFTDVSADTVTQLNSLRDSLTESLESIKTMLEELENMKLEELWSNKLREEALNVKSEVAEVQSDEDDSDEVTAASLAAGVIH